MTQNGAIPLRKGGCQHSGKREQDPYVTKEGIFEPDPVDEATARYTGTGIPEGFGSPKR